MAEERSSVIGRRRLKFDCIDSTNTQAWLLADDPQNDGVVILAREQTAGRGQHGRSWLAPPGSSVLLSVLLFPPPFLRRPALLTAWAAVSVCELIREVTGLDATIKWPNDVLIDGWKVCGILIEQRSTGAGKLASVAGIGLNVGQERAWFDQSGLPQATSLTASAGRAFDCKRIADSLVRELDEQYEELLGGNTESLEGMWRQRLELLTKRVAIECANEIREGRLAEIAFAGLRLEEADGTHTLIPEAVRHIREI